MRIGPDDRELEIGCGPHLREPRWHAVPCGAGLPVCTSADGLLPLVVSTVSVPPSRFLGRGALGTENVLPADFVAFSYRRNMN